MVVSDQVLDRLNTIKSHKDPLSQAQMLVELKASTPVANKDIAEVLGMKPSNVSHLLRVTKLPEIVLDGYVSKQISFTHLILISRLKKHDDIVNLYEEILQNGYTALQTERRIREILYLVDNFGNYVNKDKLKIYEERIERSLGTGAKATIIQTRIKTKVVIEMSGNLAKTTEFIDSFVTRFRAKRSVEPVVPDAAAVPAANGSQIEDIKTGVTQEDSNIQESQSEENLLDLEENKVKYKFDPDF